MFPMKMFELRAYIVFGLIALATGQNQKVTVTVYYESLCPDSRAFITNQLQPSLMQNNSLLEYIDLHLVPYGKSSTIFDRQLQMYNFSCHHGPDECTGNKIHACALRADQAADRNEPVGLPVLTFISCLMADVDRSQNPNVFPISACALKSEGINVAKVENCARHIDGQSYLNEFGIETEALQARLTSVPTIIVNGTDESKDSQKNFISVVCRRLRENGGHVPDVCNTPAGAAAPFIPGSILLLASFTMVLLQKLLV